MKIFVTGATGFVGRHFVRTALMNGHSVFAHGRTALSLQSLGPDVIKICKPLDDITNLELKGCDILAHFASPGVSPKVASWHDLVYWNVEVPVRVLEQAQEAGVGRIIVLGTCEEYGRSAENYDFIPPDAPLSPVTPYGISKAAGYLATTGFARRHGLPLAYLRLFHIYGEGQYENNFWPSLRAAALGGRDFVMSPGEQIRDFMPVEDAALAILHVAINSSLIAHHPLIGNIGTGKPTALKDFAQRFWHEWHATGRLIIGDVPYRSNEVMRYVPRVDTSLLK